MIDSDSKLLEWRRLAKESIDIGHLIANSASIDAWDNAKIMAATILARSISNMNGFILLIEGSQLLEAKIIARGIFENAFTIAALEKNSTAVFEHLDRDYRNSKIRRGKLLKSHTDSYTKEQIDEVDKIIDELRSGKKGREFDLADIGGCKEYVRFYAQLCADSVHVSFDSLEGHMVLKDGVLKEIQVDQWESEEEFADAIGWALMAFTIILRSAQQFFGGKQSLPAVNRFFEKCQIPPIES